METGFSIARKDSIWVLRMRDTETQGTFGSLSAALRCAYWLTDAKIGQGDCDGAAAGGDEVQHSSGHHESGEISGAGARGAGGQQGQPDSIAA